MNFMNTNYRAVPCCWKLEAALAIPETLHGCKRRIVARVVGLALLGILLGATQSYAQPWTQVQGRLIGNGHYGLSPAGGVVLTLFNSQLGVQLGPFRDQYGLSILETYRWLVHC